MGWAKTQRNLGIALHELGSLTRDLMVLRQAEQAFRNALLEHTREGAAMEWAQTQHNLASTLGSIGQLAREPAVLRQAEQAFRNALLERSREGAATEWAASQNNLGTVLNALGGLTGDVAVWRQAEQAYRNATLEATRERAPLNWAGTYNNLGVLLENWGNLTDDVAVLRRAEQAFRDALLEYTRERTPMDWAMTQNNLSIVLGNIGQLAREPAVLRQAEVACRSALLEYTRERAPMNWAMTQGNLAITLFRLGRMTHDAAILRQAETACRNALLDYTRERAPISWATSQNTLANTLSNLGEVTGNAMLLGQAEQAYRNALTVMDDSGAEDSRQGVAVMLSDLLLRQRRYDDAAAVIEPTLTRSDAALVDAARSREGTVQAVTRVRDLYAKLSLCRLRQSASDPAAALIAAESGRARLLTDALALDAVRPEEINDPDIQREVTEVQNGRALLRNRLGHRQGLRMEAQPDPVSITLEEREQLQAELRGATDTYVALCRQHGLIRTPQPLSLAEILAAAPAGGALVLPVLTETEAFAFVMVDGGVEPTVIELPRLSGKAVTEYLYGKDRWLSIYHEHFRDHREDDDGGIARRAATVRWSGQLTVTLAWLWERLLEPIHGHLRDVACLEAAAPAVILPPGLLGLLPLHAAGPGPDGRHFSEHWTVSYAPSVRSLLACQQKAKQCQTLPTKLLAAIDPRGDLRGARQEAPMLRQRFASADLNPVILTGGEATVTAVLAHLSRATHVHASTHGWHDPLQPMKSGLHLADTPLLLEMLRETRLDAARLVFLSACESGLADIRRLPEEFIGLPAGFVRARGACVIAALWPIRDDAAFLMADKFYELYLDAAGQERASPAVALRAAVDWLRQATFGMLKQRFPQADGPQGSVLVLSTTERFKPVGKEEPLYLPLGDDDECPYVAAEHWAAFTVTGA
jgi:CHAT domain-containing protein/tetratricopeptide (TPR) repeat protein